MQDDGWMKSIEVAAQLGMELATRSQMERLTQRLQRLYTLGIVMRRPHPDRPGWWLWKIAPNAHELITGERKVKLLSL